MSEKVIKELATEAEASLKAIEDVTTQMAEVSALELSTMLLAARDVHDELEAKYKEATKDLNERLRKYQATAKPARDMAKGTLQLLKEGLDACYAAEVEFIESQREQAMITGDESLLLGLPDSPEVAEGLTFSETRQPIVIDLDSLPEECIVRTANMSKIKDMLNLGPVPGVIVETTRIWKREAVKK